MAGGAGCRLFLSEELSDIRVEAGGWRFPAHRLVLSAQSDVFRCMLRSDCTEKDSGCIRITDIRPRIILLLLGYMYRGCVSLENWHETLELLRAAHKYQVEPLVQHCARFLEGVLRLENVCAVLEAACFYSLSALRDRCVALAAEAGFAALRSRGFEALREECVAAVLAHPDLLVDGELEVQQALRRRARRRGEDPFLPRSSMSDAEKSEMRARAAPPRHARRFEFAVCAGAEAAAGDALVRFSLSAPLFLVGVRVRLLAPAALPPALPLALAAPGVVGSLLAANLSAAPRREGPPGVFEVRLLLSAPLRLEAGTAYRLTLADGSQSVLCPRTRLRDRTMRTPAGIVTLSLHSEHSLGLTALVFIS